jgi:predicted HTH transcriptional regulator
LSKSLFDRLEGELKAREQQLGLRLSDLLMLPDDIRCLLNWMIRKGQVSLEEVRVFLGNDDAAARRLLADVQDRGYVREIELRGNLFYRVRLAPKRGREVPPNLWQALEEECGSGEESEP